MLVAGRGTWWEQLACMLKKADPCDIFGMCSIGSRPNLLAHKLYSLFGKSWGILFDINHGSHIPLEKIKK